VEWGAVLLLGAYHGINPGMGWLFAVALGMQQRSVRGVWRALPPIALGHTLAVGVVLLAALLVQTIVPLPTLNVGVAATLVALGLYRLWRHRHPRFGGMQVGFRDLTVWAFLMAFAHGAGIMVLPFVMGTQSPVSAARGHEVHLASASTLDPTTNGLALVLHSGAYLIVMTFIAWIVYSRLGLGLLRTAWFNLDWLWAGALVATGVFAMMR
jgi:hypothetical protein